MASALATPHTATWPSSLSSSFGLSSSLSFMFMLFFWLFWLRHRGKLVAPSQSSSCLEGGAHSGWGGASTLSILDARAIEREAGGVRAVGRRGGRNDETE